MKIGINAYEAVVPRFGFNKKTGLPNRVGSSEFCYQLLVSLSKFDKQNNYSIFLPVNPSLDMPKETEKWKYVVFQAKKLWTLWGLSKRFLTGRDGIEVFFLSYALSSLEDTLPIRNSNSRCVVYLFSPAF